MDKRHSSPITEGGSDLFFLDVRRSYAYIVYHLSSMKLLV